MAISKSHLRRNLQISVSWFLYICVATKSFWTSCVLLFLCYMSLAHNPVALCFSAKFCVSINYKFCVLEFCVSIKYKFCVLEFCVSIKYKFRLNVSSGSPSPLLANCRQKASRHDPPLATSTRPCEVSCHKIQVKTTRKYNTTNIYHDHKCKLQPAKMIPLPRDGENAAHSSRMNAIIWTLLDSCPHCTTEICKDTTAWRKPNLKSCVAILRVMCRHVFKSDPKEKQVGARGRLLRRQLWRQPSDALGEIMLSPNPTFAKELLKSFLMCHHHPPGRSSLQQIFIPIRVEKGIVSFSVMLKRG